MPSWLITGTSKGIGLGIVCHLLKEEKNFVIGTARDLSAKALQELAAIYPKNRLALIELDITDVTSVKKAAEEAAALLPNGLDYLINNAGISLQIMTPFEDLDMELFAEELNFYTVSVIQVTTAFLPLIRKSAVKKMIFITSILGSLETSGSWPLIGNSYSISKAALNMLACKWGAALKNDGIIVALVHPGWVQTNMGDPCKEWAETYAPNIPQITVAQSSAGIVEVAKSITTEAAVPFYQYDGSRLPF